MVIPAEDNIDEISIIIPTYNRVDDLKSCLKSILVQTKKPKEVLIVDDSEGDKTRCQVEAERMEFVKNGITLRYLKNTRGKSSAIARNVGIDNALGGIILFLDDDVILSEDYLENISYVYANTSGCIGVQGYILLKNKLNKFYNLMSMLVFYNYTGKNSCRVLPSTCITYPHPLEKTINCEWLAGSNQSYLRSVLVEFKFDENFRRYSWREDVDLSYRIGKRYPGSLYITPYAKLVHNISDKARMPDKALTYMKEVYSFYFFFKNIEQIPKNKLIFFWSKIGFLLQVLAIFLLRPTKATRSKILRLRYLFGAYAMCIKYLNEIRRGDLEFFNRKLESSNA